MGLSDHWSVEQIDRAVASLQPGEGFLVKDGKVWSTFKGRVVKPKKKTKRGRRRKNVHS